MSVFATNSKHFGKNASFSACSSCHAKNTVARKSTSDYISFADTVLSVSAFLFAIIGAICISLIIGLIDIIIINAIIICLIKAVNKKQNKFICA